MMEEELNKIKISFMNSYKKRAYFSALESIYEFAEIIDKEKYIDYMEKRFDYILFAVNDNLKNMDILFMGILLDRYFFNLLEETVI